jgi:hypothetical protein
MVCQKFLPLIPSPPGGGGERVRVRGARKELLPIAINGVAKLSLGTRKTIFQ